MKSWEMKSPEKFLFTTSPIVAEKFRLYCAVNKFRMGRVLESLIVDFLIKEGVIENKEALELEEQMSK